jgi:hypothetical protein
VKKTIFIALITTSFLSNAQELRVQAIQNIGSSVAYLALCEKEKLTSESFASKIILSAQKNLGQKTYEKIRDQYQKSLHEKKQYSIAGDKWISMKVNKENCMDLESGAPVLVNHFNEIGKNYQKGGERK